MSRNQNPHQGKFGRHPDQSTSSLGDPSIPARFATTQGTRLPPFSTLFKSGAASPSAVAMDVDNVNRDVNGKTSEITERAFKAISSSHAETPHSRGTVRSSKHLNNPISLGPVGSLTRRGQNVCMPQSSLPQNFYRSHNTGPQPVGSTINVAPNAPFENTFHVARMENCQIVVEIAAVTPKSTDNQLVPWEPNKPSDSDSRFLSSLDHKVRQGSTYQKLQDTILGKRSHTVSEREAAKETDRDGKKNKSSEGPNLAASLDALAREHARSSISFSTISIPSSVSTRNGGQGAGDSHGRGCSISQVTDNVVSHGKGGSSNQCEPETPKQKNDTIFKLQRGTTAEPGNELDFLASVVLSQNDSPEGEGQQTILASQEVSAAGQHISDTVVQPIAIAGQNSQTLAGREAEPRSETSFVLDDEAPQPVLPQMAQVIAQPSSINSGYAITDESIAIVGNPASTEVQVSVSPCRANAIPRNVQTSPPRLPAMAQLPTNASKIGLVIAKGRIGYKLKRGPKSKKKKQDEVIPSIAGKARRSKGIVQKKISQAASSSKAHAFRSRAIEEDASKQRKYANGNQEDIQPNRKPTLSSHSVSDRSSKGSATSKERMLPSDSLPNTTSCKKALTYSKGISRCGSSPRSQEEHRVEQDEGLISLQHRRSIHDSAGPSSALAPTVAIQSEPKPNASRVEQVSQEVENLLNQLRKEAPSSANAAGDATVAAAPPITVESIIAAAKQSPAYVHKCKLCDSVFNRRFNLNKHIRNVHENIRKFGCTACGEHFLQKSHLAAHTLAVHDKSRPFHCELCPKRFSWIGVLRKHMQAIHKVTLQKKTVRNDTSPILTAINENIGTIRQIRLEGKDSTKGGVSSSPGKEITTPATVVVVTPQKSALTPVPHESSP